MNENIKAALLFSLFFVVVIGTICLFAIKLLIPAIITLMGGLFLFKKLTK